MSNRHTKTISVTVPLTLIFTLFPLTSWADMGSVGGPMMIAFWIALAIWSGLTLGVFLLLRRRAIFTRFAATALFFLAPALLVMVGWFSLGVQLESDFQATGNMGALFFVPDPVKQVTPCVLQALCELVNQ